MCVRREGRVEAKEDEVQLYTLHPAWRASLALRVATLFRAKEKIPLRVGAKTRCASRGGGHHRARVSGASLGRDAHNTAPLRALSPLLLERAKVSTLFSTYVYAPKAFQSTCLSSFHI
jgi:hypothetical protein